MALTTTWTQQDTVSFTAGTLATISSIRGEVEKNIHRGTLSGSSSPTSTQVDSWIIRGKQELCEIYGFSWRRKYVYADLAAGTWRYAMPADFTGGGAETRIRNLTDDVPIEYVDNITFDMEFPDVAGSSNGSPDYYTIKDRELWFSCPANGVYRLELEYPRTGDDTTTTDVSYIPESFRYDLADYGIYKSYLFLQMWQEAQFFKVDWEEGIQESKKPSGKSKWSAMGYRIQNWQNVKI